MTASDNRHKPIRQLGLVSAISVVISTMIGTGIFTTTGLLAADLGASVPILIGWLLGGIIALCGALTYAELAVAMPGNGGEYLYLSRLYHPAVGFLSGWVSLFAGFSAPIAAAAVAFGKYAHAVAPEVPAMQSSIAVVLIFTLLHLLNVRAGSIVLSLFALANAALIAIFIAAGLLMPDKISIAFTGSDLQTVISPAFAVGLIFIMYSYAGWNSAAYIAGEVKNPATTLPLALIAGTIIVSILYTGLNVLYLSTVPLASISGKVEVAHIVAYKLFGDAGAKIISVLIALALVASISGMTMAGARIYQVMGEDHPFFAWLAHRSKNNTPDMAILLQSGIALMLTLTFTFDAILYYVGFTLSLFTGLTVFSVFILRKKPAAQQNLYRTWGYPFTPILFLAITSWMVLYTFLNQPVESLIGLATLCLGMAVYHLLSAKKST